MPYINWDYTLELGHGQIDTEHQALLGHVNRLVEIVFSDDRAVPGFNGCDSRRACIEAAVDVLYQATAEHFRSEESLMEASEFPGRRYHAEQHGELLAQLAGFAEHYHSTNADSLPHAVRFLREWIEFHIDTYDRALVRWLKTGDATPLNLED
jgi:hemerythrin